MSTPQFPSVAITVIAQRMEAFEAGASVAHTGTGSRREGEQFEHLVATFWTSLVDYLVPFCDLVESVPTNMTMGGAVRKWSRLTRAGRSLYIPDSTDRGVQTTECGRR